MHPLLVTDGLSDAQIMDKIALCSARIMAVRKSGQSGMVVNQLKQVMLACQMELAERHPEPMEKENVAWDMDSYLEQNKQDASRDKEQENIPRWKSAALNELSDQGDSPWG